MGVLKSKVQTITIAMNGTTPVNVGAFPITGFGDAMLAITNGTGGQALTLTLYVDPTGTTAPTTSSGLHRVNKVDGTADTLIVAAGAKGAYRLAGLTGNYVFISAVLAGSGTESSVYTLCQNASAFGPGNIL